MPPSSCSRSLHQRTHTRDTRISSLSMPPKKKATVETAKKAPATPIKTPPASPAKATISSPSPTGKSPSHATSPHPRLSGTPNQGGKGEHCRSHSVHETTTPKRPSQQQQQQQPLRTPERQGSSQQRQHRSDGSPSRSRTVDGAASPSMPPAPASTPVPASSGATVTPRRGSSPGSVQSPLSRSAAAALSLSASPVPPPPPPTTPVPLTKRTSTSQQPPQQQGTPSSKKGRAGSAPGGTPGQQAKTAAAAAATTPPQEEKTGATAVAAAAAADAHEKAEPRTKSRKQQSRNVRRQRSRHGGGESSSTPSSSSPMAHAVENFIRESKVIAPDVSGLCCLAVHPSEQQVIVARENGSLVLYDVSFFQNIPQFVQRRHTGGQTRRTVTSLAYVAVPTPAATSTTHTATASSSSAAPTDAGGVAGGQPASTRYVVLASMLSGQIVVYDADLLVPIALHQRSGGAIWQLTAVSPACVYAAMADGSWQQLRLTCRRDGAAPQLELVRVVPGISGADRALTVATSTTLRMAVGSDDAGNVHAWRLPTSASGAEGADEDGSSSTNAAAARSRGLAEHESLWTTKLAKGIALSCAVVGGTQRPCVVVGTSMGDVVLLDAAHGHVFQTFAQHKGPVTTLVVHQDTVVFASGWHESLRSYRCSSEGDWHPAEVKRRTHYHEASQLAIMPHRQLMLSASRDGTIMYSPIAQLFHSPAMYVTVTTQQFAYAPGRSLLLQSRFDTIEAFCMDGASRHWVPFFGHRLDGRFHLSGLWSDAQLHYILFSTEERVGLLKVVWRAQAALSIARIEEVLELPARTGVADVCWSCGTAPALTRNGEGAGANNHGSSSSSSSGDEAAAAKKDGAATRPTVDAPRVLYVLYDDCITSVTLADGYPVVHTALQVRGKGLPADSLRPHRAFCRPSAEAATKKTAKNAAATAATAATEATSHAAQELVVYGHRGSCRLQLLADGTPDAGTLVADLDDVYELVQEVPTLRTATSTSAAEEHRAKKVKTEASNSAATAAAAAAAVCDVATSAELVGLSAVQQRYVAGSTLHSAAAGTVPLPSTLPHDVRWVARVASSPSGGYKYLGYFSRGLLVATGDAWHMVRRMSVEAAFVVNGGAEVLVLERNLEKTLEALPLSWKVRRFGN